VQADRGCHHHAPLRVVLDLFDQSGNHVAVVIGREISKSRERLELDFVAGGVVVLPEILSSTAGDPLFGPVQPVADERLAEEKRARHVGARPFEGAFRRSARPG